MTDLSVSYLGLNLKNPIVVGSSGLTNSIEDLKALEAKGAGAIVLKSIFEEEIIAEMKKYSITINGETNHSGGYYLYTSTSSKISELQSKMQEMLPKLMAYATKNNINIAGAPFVNYIKWDEENNAAIFSCCIPTTERVITLEGDDVLTGEFESFRAIKTTLKGNYSHLTEAWSKTKKYIPENGFEVMENGPMLETYLNDPTKTPNPANLVTEIYIAIKDTIQ